MSDNTVYRVNDPSVTSEEIDGEVIIVNLLNGNYYSAVNVAACLWTWVLAGYSVEQMRSELTNHYAEHAGSIDSDLSQFFANLESDNLVVRPDRSQVENVCEESAGEGVTFPDSYSAPVLSCYSDMQDLLLLDPIHDVADVGWPTAKSEADG